MKLSWPWGLCLGLALLVGAGVSAQGAGAKKIKVLVYGGGVIHDFKGVTETVMEVLGRSSRLAPVLVTDDLVPPPPPKPGEKPAKLGVESKLDEMIKKLTD